jgi:hypothetical protein
VEDTPWSKGGEEQLDAKMDMELDRKSPEEHNEEKLAGRSRTRSDRPPDRGTRSQTGFCACAILALSRGPGTPSGCRPVQGPVWTGLPGPRPGLTGPLTGLHNLSHLFRPESFHLYLFGP